MRRRTRWAPTGPWEVVAFGLGGRPVEFDRVATRAEATAIADALIERPDVARVNGAILADGATAVLRRRRGRTWNASDSCSS